MTRSFNSFHSFRSHFRAQRGVAAVEFAIMLIFLLLIAAGIFGFGRAFWYYNALAKATRDGARAMSVTPKDSILSAGVPAAQALVVAEVNGANLSPPLSTGDVSVTCNPACTDTVAPTEVTVQIDYTIDIGGIFPFITPSYAVKRYQGVTLAPYTTMRYLN